MRTASQVAGNRNTRRLAKSNNKIWLNWGAAEAAQDTQATAKARIKPKQKVKGEVSADLLIFAQNRLWYFPHLSKAKLNKASSKIRSKKGLAAPANCATARQGSIRRVSRWWWWCWCDVRPAALKQCQFEALRSTKFYLQHIYFCWPNASHFVFCIWYFFFFRFLSFTLHFILFYALFFVAAGAAVCLLFAFGVE